LLVVRVPVCPVRCVTFVYCCCSRLLLFARLRLPRVRFGSFAPHFGSTALYVDFTVAFAPVRYFFGLARILPTDSYTFTTFPIYGLLVTVARSVAVTSCVTVWLRFVSFVTLRFVDVGLRFRLRLRLVALHCVWIVVAVTRLVTLFDFFHALRAFAVTFNRVVCFPAFTFPFGYSYY